MPFLHPRLQQQAELGNPFIKHPWGGGGGRESAVIILKAS